MISMKTEKCKEYEQQMSKKKVNAFLTVLQTDISLDLTKCLTDYSKHKTWEVKV